MNQLETFLQQPLPREEAASFFIRLKGGEKTASTKEVLEHLSALPEEERTEILKSAAHLPPSAHGQVKKANEVAGYPGAPAQLPAAAKGTVMAPAAPAALPSTAMGQNMGAPKMASAKSPTDVGKARGEANTAAHFERESHRHGERSGTTLGRVAGLAAGAAAAHKLGKGNPMVDIAGAALGQHVGAGLGRHAGKAHDERAFTQKQAATVERFHPGTLGYHGDAVATALLHGNTKGTVVVPDLSKYASAFKLALESMGMASGQPAQQNLQSPPGIEPKLDPEMQEYLANEQGMDSQAMKSELDHARQALSAAVTAQQQLEAKTQQLETKQQMVDSQLSQYQAQVADATQSAMAAQDEVLQNQQSAAAMRMAYQQLRGQLLQAASVDPPMLGGNEAAMAAASTAAGPSSAPAPQEGPAGQAPSPGTAPNSAAPQGDDQVSARSQTSQQADVAGASTVGQKEPSGDAKTPSKEVLSSARLLPFVVAEKLGSLRELLSQQVREAIPGIKAVLPHAAIGGLIGGGLGFAESQMSNEPLRQKVKKLESKGDRRSTGDAVNLAVSRGRLTLGEHAAKHPIVSTAMGALTGATTGARGGPAFVNALKSMKDDVGGMASDIKTIRGK